MSRSARKQLNSKANPSVFGQVASDYGLSWWVMVLFSVPALEAQLVSDSMRLGGGIILWIQLGVAAQLLAVSIFAVGRFLIKPHQRTPKLWAVLALYATIGFARGIFLHFASLGAGLDSSDELAYRLISGPIFTLFLMPVCAVVVSNYQRHRQLRSELAKERGRLRLASFNLRAQVERLRTELVTRVSAMLDPAISNLEHRLSDVRDPKTTSIAVSDLRSTVDDVVRPLSHDIGHSNFDELILQTEEQIREQVVPRLRKVPVNLLPTWSAVLTLTVSLGTTSQSRGILGGLLLTAISSVLIWLWLTLVQKILGTRKFKVWIVGVIFIVTYLASSFLIPLINNQIGLTISSDEAVEAHLLLTLMGLVFFVATVTNEFRRVNIEKLRQANRNFQLLNSKLRRQVWLDHRRIASVLHGQLQGALYAAAIRLNQAQNPDSKLLEAVRKDIRNAMQALYGDHRSLEDFNQIYRDLIDMWSDSVAFTTDFEEPARDALRNDLDVAECVLEVVREAINNAVRHGKANQVIVTGRLKSSQVLEVRVTNNGAPVSDDAIRGFGSEVLTECAHGWSLKNTPEGVTLCAQFAL